MFPPSQGLSLDIDAISGICGSISIACWIVVFSPQIIENFRRDSAEGLSVLFIAVWLAGDVFNILGAVLQGVLPTMIILAVYYTFADLVLLAQCFYYKGFTLKDEIKKPDNEEAPRARPDELSPLLSTQADGNGHSNGTHNGHSTPPRISDIDRRHSHSSFRERLLSVDGTHLSPVMPLHPEPSATELPQSSPAPSQTTLQAVLFNLGAIALVCAAGVFGWWLSARSNHRDHNRHHDDAPDLDHEDTLHFSLWGQIFGYICALLYLGSRIPQLLLNYRRKSTEGISMLFFLFACIGNLTYVLSIFAYLPTCRMPRRCGPGESGRLYARYIAVNLSWLLGSFGTLLLDGFVFVQYFLYRKDEEGEDEVEDEVVG
ncbi:PQ-loop-domain-containing protein [Lepidopterella palustris CBS 459.81]|uniref:PQ-loop-domain-containing protein n=1 Tax=Lepidopterella palustris CBS 459.81 TaxID=1314670 RepID=A0A8E2EDN1_9PEZI|nr:PQ-loop-domain-containing protein [Lepidopterella palustris CBS 459.81]